MKTPEINLEHGYYFSPGFYQSFWTNCIEKQLSVKDIQTHDKLKKYREVWVGAIVAALQTKITTQQHFVGLPLSEPPDVEIVRLVPILTPKGKEALRRERMNVEITRCNTDVGENLLDQIRPKNTQANSDLILLVYIYGSNQSKIDFKQVQKEIAELGKIYPSEILVLGAFEKAGDQEFPPGSYVQIQLYPEYGIFDVINISDKNSFFTNPNVIKPLSRNPSRELTYLTDAKLSLPDLD